MHTWVCVDGSFKEYPQDPDHAIDCAPCLKKRWNARYDLKFGVHDQGHVRSENLARAPVKHGNAAISARRGWIRRVRMRLHCGASDEQGETCLNPKRYRCLDQHRPDNEQVEEMGLDNHNSSSSSTAGA